VSCWVAGSSDPSTFDTKAAKDAAPTSDADALQMQAAEDEGKRHAKGEDPALNRKSNNLAPDAARTPKPGGEE